MAAVRLPARSGDRSPRWAPAAPARIAGRPVADALVLPLRVIAGDPRIELRLGLLDRGEGALGKELLSDGLVQPLDLAGGGRRVRGRQDVAGPGGLGGPGA